jgi:hypothetical protein
MGDMKEDFQALEQCMKERKSERKLRSILMLQKHSIKFTILNEDGPHLRIGDYDFWPSTDKWIHRKTNKRGWTVDSLIDVLEREAVA